MTLPLWKKIEESNNEIIEEQKNDLGINSTKIPGVKLALITFFCYCAVEATTGLWGSSYLVNYKGLSAGEAARWISLFYGGITLGRFLTGFLTMKFDNSTLIRMGQIMCIIGVGLFILPLPVYFTMIALIFIGLGCAPIFPCMIHETPKRFGKVQSQAIMGLQMAFGYIGITFMPPILGVIASKTSIMIFPYFLFLNMLVMLISSEKINISIRKKQQIKE
jgi:fucose permease